MKASEPHTRLRYFCSPYHQDSALAFTQPPRSEARTGRSAIGAFRPWLTGRLSTGVAPKRARASPTHSISSPSPRLRVAVRHPSRVQVTTESAQAAEYIQADVLDDVAVGGAIAGTGAVVNLVGILTETARQTYRAVHVEGARRVALAAQRHGVMRLIHISALGASPTSPAISDQTKAGGEHAVRAVFPQVTLVRPSLTFGEDDHFFSRFAMTASDEATQPKMPPCALIMRSPNS